jgi:hypothetical protein
VEPFVSMGTVVNLGAVLLAFFATAFAWLRLSANVRERIAATRLRADQHGPPNPDDLATSHVGFSSSLCTTGSAASWDQRSVAAWAHSSWF